MGASFGKECSVVHLTTAKHDALVVVPVNIFSVPSQDSPLFELLYSARCDPYVRHWFGSPSMLEQQSERGIKLTPSVTADEFYNVVVANFGEATTQWMVLRLTDDFTNSLPSPYVPLSFLVNHVKANQARTSAAGYFSLGISTMLHQGFRSADFFMTRALCNDAKSGVLFQLVSLQSQRFVEQQPPNSSPTPRLPLALHVRQGNLPVIRMFQKLYTQHVSPLASGLDDLVQISQVQPGWLRVFIDDGQLVESIRWRLASTIQMVVGPDASSRLVLFTDRHRAEVPTPFDNAVERAVPIWDVERHPVVQEAKIGSTTALSSSGLLGQHRHAQGDATTSLGTPPFPVGGAQFPQPTQRVTVGMSVTVGGPRPRYKNPTDPQQSRVPNQIPRQPASYDAARFPTVPTPVGGSSPPLTTKVPGSPSTPTGGQSRHSPSAPEFWDNTYDSTSTTATEPGSQKHARYSSIGTATSFTSELSHRDDVSEEDAERDHAQPSSAAAATAHENVGDGTAKRKASTLPKQFRHLDPATIPPFTPAQIWREGGWASYWFSPDTYSPSAQSRGCKLSLTEEQPYSGAVLMRGRGEFRFLDAAGATVNIRSSGAKSSFFLSVPTDSFASPSPSKESIPSEPPQPV